MKQPITDKYNWPILLVMVGGGVVGFIADLSFWQGAVLGAGAGIPVILLGDWLRRRSRREEAQQ